MIKLLGKVCQSVLLCRGDGFESGFKSNIQSSNSNDFASEFTDEFTDEFADAPTCVIAIRSGHGNSIIVRSGLPPLRH